LVDPYLQWSPPKFWTDPHQIDYDNISIENWINDTLRHFNWAYFRSLLEGSGPLVADINHLSASIFDTLYEEYIYYAICGQLWSKNQGTITDPDRDILVGAIRQQVIVNFTDIVDSIHKTLISELGLDPIIDPIVDHIDVEGLPVSLGEQELREIEEGIQYFLKEKDHE